MQDIKDYLFNKEHPAFVLVCYFFSMFSKYTLILLGVFILFRLFNIITWSLWWVLSPMYIPFVISILVFLIEIFIKKIIKIFGGLKNKR